MRTRTRRRSTFAVGAALLLAAACGDDGNQAPSAAPASAAVPGAHPVSVDNCGRTTVYEAAPERAVPVDQNVTELLLFLGLEDRIAGYVRQHFNPVQPVLAEYAEPYARLRLLAEKSPSREVFLAADPDFTIAAWAFSEDTGITTETLDADGVASYILPDQCDGRTAPATFEDLYRATADVAAIFGVPQRAEGLIAEWKATIDQVKARVGDAEPVRVMAFDSGDDAPFTAGGRSIVNQIIEAAGGTNIFADANEVWFNASWEAALARDPQVVVIMDYFHGEDGTATAGKRQIVRDRLSPTEAVTSGRVIDRELTGYFLSPRNAATVEDLAAFLHP